MWFWKRLWEWWNQVGWVGVEVVEVVEVVVGKIRVMGQIWLVGVVTMAGCEKGWCPGADTKKPAGLCDRAGWERRVRSVSGACDVSYGMRRSGSITAMLDWQRPRWVTAGN